MEAAHLRIYASLNRVSNGSDNGISLIWRQAIIQTNAVLLSNETLGENIREILIKIQYFPFTKMYRISFFKMTAILAKGKWVNHMIFLLIGFLVDVVAKSIVQLLFDNFCLCTLG